MQSLKFTKQFNLMKLAPFRSPPLIKAHLRADEDIKDGEHVSCFINFVSPSILSSPAVQYCSNTCLLSHICAQVCSAVKCFKMTGFRLLVVECFENIALCFTAVESYEPQCNIDLEERHNDLGLSVLFFISLAVCTISRAPVFFF